jgi:hypothetical protein
VIDALRRRPLIAAGTALAALLLVTTSFVMPLALADLSTLAVPTTAGSMIDLGFLSHSLKFAAV